MHNEIDQRENFLSSEKKLQERIKELNCLYALSRLEEKCGLKVDILLKNAVALIPPAWQYPEITCARLIYEDQCYHTENFKETRWMQTVSIKAEGAYRGSIQVFYTEEKEPADEGPFLTEERQLLNTFADFLGRKIDQINARLAVREREKNFRDLLENALMGVIIVQENQIVYINSEQKRISGYAYKLFESFEFSHIHPDDINRVKNAFDNLSSGKSSRIELSFRFTALSNQEIKWIYCRASSFEFHGKQALLINMLDVTREKKIESLLRMQDKMISLGRVAAGIAHEIRNPLSGINIYLTALNKTLSDIPESEKASHIIGQMHSASQKIESVIRRVMDFSRPVEPRYLLVNIADPVEEAVNLLTVTLSKSNITIQNRINKNLPKCNVDPQLIEQVILNLMTNAAEAMRGLESRKIIRIDLFQDEESICIEISDSGPGVPLHLKDKIFDPFYSTKLSGTGIGLSLCYRIISDHGGSLEVADSKLGGAKFTVRLPVERISL